TISESSNEKRYSRKEKGKGKMIYRDNSTEREDTTQKETTKEVRNSSIIPKIKAEKEIKTDNVSKGSGKRRFSEDTTEQENPRKETKQNQTIEKLNI
ncbi:6630_t:CDS:1, partial [Scutellospora calospora]